MGVDQEKEENLVNQKKNFLDNVSKKELIFQGIIINIKKFSTLSTIAKVNLKVFSFENKNHILSFNLLYIIHILELSADFLKIFCEEIAGSKKVIKLFSVFKIIHSNLISYANELFKSLFSYTCKKYFCLYIMKGQNSFLD